MTTYNFTTSYLSVSPSTSSAFRDVVTATSCHASNVLDKTVQFCASKITGGRI